MLTREMCEDRFDFFCSINPTKYGYDSNAQLTSVSGGSVEAYGYDDLGNRILDSVGAYNFDVKKQRLISDYRYQYFYDNNGNITSKQEPGLNGDVTNYVYNSFNQLTKIETYENSIKQTEIHFYYDPFGRRLKKSVLTSGSSPTEKSKKYEYDGSEIIAVYGTDNDILVTYTPSFIRTDDPLAMDVTLDGVSSGVAPVSTNYFFVKDHIGSIQEIRNSAGGLVQRYQYSAFGEIQKIFNSSGLDISSSPVVEPHYAFAGREYDTESKLYFNRARYYDSQIGRFLQEDPHPGKLESPITVSNKYIYAANNPVRYTDPEGKYIVAAIVVGAVVGGLIAHFTGQNVLEGMLIGSVAGLGGAWAGGAAYSAAGGGVIGGGAGAFMGAVVGGLAGGSTAGLINYGGGGFHESFNRGAGIGAVAGGVTGGTLGYYGSWGSAYAAGENYVLGLFDNPIGYALENPGSTIVPTVGIIGGLICKVEKKSEPFSKSFSCSL